MELKLSIESIPLNIDKAIPCGLIINELVSNAFKYAFKNSSEHQAIQGKIKVQLQLKDKRNVLLVVADNGKGLSKKIDFRNSPSLGLQLVNSLAAQIDGTINYRNENGALFEIQFSLDDEQAEDA